MPQSLKLARWSRLLVVLVVLPLSSCCEDQVYTYEDAVQQINQQRTQLRRLTVQRSVVEKKWNFDRQTANATSNPAEFLRQAQAEHDQRAADLNRQIAEERTNLRKSEALIASMRPAPVE
jgi:hypothetical protein